ncbi:hypothetical protein BROUX41_000962 [Berkeleyomyces rouxiae]|uniref:uncharacterized protein n=1 Tax=Berkeleyomyces rouxiae TaxID=2035830 RepID=UPI003B7B79B0
MATLVPRDPAAVTVTAQPTPNILTLSVPFLRFGRIPIGGRATVARLLNGSLAVFSPIALTPAVHTALATLGGDVRYIVAPDAEHHLFLSSWQTAFPSALLIGVDGLPEKRAAAAARAQGKPANSGPQITDIPFSAVFTAENKAKLSIDEPFDATFNYEFVDAHGNKELVFLHKADRTLIQADLLFNLPATEQYSKAPEEFAKKSNTLFYKIFASFTHTDPAHMTLPRIWQYYVTCKSKESYEKSMRRIASWDFDTIIPCHGDVIKGDGKERFTSVMMWFLDKKNKSS